MLDLTPKEVKERSALRVNPCKICQPVGAMYAALGVKKLYAPFARLAGLLFLSQDGAFAPF